MSRSASRPSLRVSMVGSGFMGRAHAQAFLRAAFVYDLPRAPFLEMIADIEEVRAAKAASDLGFARHTANWRTLVTDPHVDLVAIATPNQLHAPIALAALAAGKAV